MARILGNLRIDLEEVQAISDKQFDAYVDELVHCLSTVRGWKPVPPTETTDPLNAPLRARSALEQALYDRINGQTTHRGATQRHSDSAVQLSSSTTPTHQSKE